MRTRQGNYPLFASCLIQEKSGRSTSQMARKKLRTFGAERNLSNKFDMLPDDLLISIFVSLGSTATSPADLINTMKTCKRFHGIALHPLVLANASLAALTVQASRWSEEAHRYLTRCADSGNVEAFYTLGMIRFYCFQNRSGGTSLMAKAAIASHSYALHSLAIIHFNGSGGTRKDKDLKAGVALCARAAALGHIDAMRELGHCLQDGYGITKNVLEGRRLLLEANAREAAVALLASSAGHNCRFTTGCKLSAGCFHHQFLYQPSMLSKISGIQRDHQGPQQVRIRHVDDCIARHAIYSFIQTAGRSLLSDFGCNVPPPKFHTVHQFLVDWFALHLPTSGLRLCSHAKCGRVETRKHEFRRCSACGTVNYCSRACQALDWKLRHKYDCSPVADWEDRPDNADVLEDVDNEL